MKSRICCCNGTLLRKDLTRFAPVMLLSGLFLAMMGYSMRSVYEFSELAEWNMEPVQYFHIYAGFLGFVSALCLFGYLTKKKECDAMHALPVRRETMFLTHCIAALLQFVIPFGIVYIFVPGDRGWGFQMLLTACAWLFSFGLTVFCMMLAGRKLAAAMLYYLLSDIVSSIILVIDTLYIPLLPGLYLDSDLVYTLSPSSHMLSLNYSTGKLSELLLYMGLYALLGVALLVSALLLYRRRKLERAGDFLAEKWLEPVFAWGLGVGAACFCVGMGYLVNVSYWIPLAVGLAVGYFAARMLFARSIKVFSKQNLQSFTALVAVMAASMTAVSMDPMGLVKKVPAEARIESITLSDAYSYDYGYSPYAAVCDTADPEEIATLRAIHQEIVNLEEIPEYDILDEDFYLSGSQFYLTYHLTDGSELRRSYWITEEDHLARIETLLSQPEHLLGVSGLEELMSTVSELEAYGTGGGMIHTRRAFFEVFLADCEAGNMYTTDLDKGSAWSISMNLNRGGETQYRSIDIPTTAENTIRWLEEYFH